MLQNIKLGNYISGNSYLHISDPRAKLVSTMILIITSLSLKSFIQYAIFIIFFMITVAISSIKFEIIFKSIKSILFLIVFSSIINIFTMNGKILFKLYFIEVSYEGIIFSIQTTVKLSLLIMLSSLLMFTTTPISLTDGLELLFKPLKKINVPVHEIAMMMCIAIRFIPVLFEESEKIIKAQTSRGADISTGNFYNRVKNFLPILIPLFIGTIRRADELAMAMEARAYTGGEGRTKMRPLKISSKDYYMIATVIALFFVVLLI